MAQAARPRCRCSQSRPPHKPFVGRDTVVELLTVLRGAFSDVAYTDDLKDDGKRALVHRARIGEFEAEGIQRLRFNDDDQIVDITVMLRPMRASIALAEAIGPRIERLPDGTQWREGRIGLTGFCDTE